jgi:hypothetical protein
MTTEAATTDLHAFTETWLKWYRAQEVRLAAPHGFLAITGLHWLDDRPQRFPDAPGAWRTGPEGVVVDLDEGEELVVDGTPVRGEHRFGPSWTTAADAPPNAARNDAPASTRRRAADHTAARRLGAAGLHGSWCLPAGQSVPRALRSTWMACSTAAVVAWVPRTGLSIMKSWSVAL